MESTPRLYYFDIPGLAEPTRLALHLGNIRFEDVRFSFEEWPLYKPLSPSGHVPLLELGHRKYIEHKPILMWAAAKSKLIPSDATQRAVASTFLEILTPALTVVTKYYAGLITTLDDFHGIVIPKLSQAEQLLLRCQSEEGYVVRSGLSFADVYATAMMYGALQATTIRSVFTPSKFPRISRVYSLVVSHPQVQAYWRTTRHPLPPSLSFVAYPYFSPLRSCTPVAPEQELSPAGPTASPTIDGSAPLLKRSDLFDGAEAIVLLLKLGGVEFIDERSPSMRNKVQLTHGNLCLDGWNALLTWAADTGRFATCLPNEEQLLSNVIAFVCADIFRLAQHCAIRNIPLSEEKTKLAECLANLENMLAQSSMEPIWSDMCVVTVCALLSRNSIFRSTEQWSAEYPYTYLKKIQAAPLHPRVSEDILRLNSTIF